ncbi:discoidin domain-containing protein [Kitasatospora sp. NPDC015120]|uniref:discoidin domain-containing protein n=1 Tax=Kitasatospora sp. NPDC015120 TaxID=3364023 RepID=UPI0036F4858B
MRVLIPSLTALLLAPLPPLVTAASAATAPSVWVESGYEHVFSSSPAPSRATDQRVELHAARNETQAAQIAVRSDSALTGLRLVPGDLTGPGGAVIPASRITVNREYNHPNIHKSTSPDDHHQEPPDGGTSYYDALVENDPGPLAANTTQPYYYSVAVPEGQAPGTYTGRTTVQSSAGPVDVPVSVTVYAAALPPTNRSTFRMNNWFTSVGWDYTWTSSAIPSQYTKKDEDKKHDIPIEAYDEQWWQVITNFAADHAKHRNNVIYADFQALAIPDTTADAHGNLTFTWKTFDRFVQIFQDAGALQYIYTPTLLAGGYAVETLVPDGHGGVRMEKQNAGTGPANDYMKNVLIELKKHLDTKCLDAGTTCAPGRRWSDVFYMSASDEPSPADTPLINSAGWLYDIYHEVFGPQALSNESRQDPVSAIDDKLSTITSIGGPQYDANTGYYQSRRLDGGKDFWLYYCNNPNDSHLNRYIAYPTSDSRLTPWMVAATGGNGFLHWGWNIWSQSETDPSARDTFDGEETGDNYLVRPNKATYGVYDSVRSEALLAGIQDYELLNQLSATKPVLTRALINSLISGTTKFSKSGAATDQRHRQILTALTTPGPDAVFPYTDEFGAEKDTNWRTVRGSWKATGDGVYAQTDPETGWDVVAGLTGRAYGDVSASVDVRIDDVRAEGGQSNWAGLVLHNQNPTEAQTGYLVALRNTGQVFIDRGGKPLGSAQVPGYTPGQTVSLRVSVQGGTIRVYAGPTLLLTATDTGYPVGGFGLATGGASARFQHVRLNPGTDVAENAAVQADTSYEGDGWSTRALTDGRRGPVGGTNGWSSNGTPGSDHKESVTLDLLTARRIGRVDLHPRADGTAAGRGFPVDFTVKVSADGANWTTVADRTNYPTPVDASVQSFPFPATDARYVRVEGTRLGTDPKGDYRMQFAEIEATGGELATGRPVTASSTVGDVVWRPGAATDGIVNSTSDAFGWSSAKAAGPVATEWITVDLQGPSLIGQVALNPRTDGANTGLGFPVDYTVKVSADGVNWTTVADRTGTPRPGAAPLVHTFAPTTARYVKVTGTRLSADQFGDHYLQLGEIGVR